MVLARFPQCIRTQFVLPPGVTKGALATGQFQLGFAHWLGQLFHIQCTFRVGNLFTQVMGDDLTVSGIHTFALMTDHCGTLAMTAQDFVISDPLGFFAFAVKMPPQQEVVTLFPQGGGVVGPMALENFFPEGDAYSHTRAGNDPSETFNIRPYIPGDRIQLIHWKLSEKLDSTMIRELGHPEGARVLLAFNSHQAPPHQRDALAELFFSAMAVIRSIHSSVVSGGRLDTVESMDVTPCEDKRSCIFSNPGFS